MAILRARHLAVAVAIALAASSCHAVLGFEEGTPLGEGGGSVTSQAATSGGTTTNVSSASSASSASEASTASSSSTTGGDGGAGAAGDGGRGGSDEGGGGAGAAGGGGGGGPLPDECETGPKRVLRFGDAADQWRAFGAFGPDERLVLGGTFAGTIDLGGGALTADTDGDAFFASFDGTGALVHDAAYTGTASTFGRAVQSLVVGTNGVSLMAGSFGGSLEIEDLGPGASLGGIDGFVAKVGATGDVLWVTPIAGANEQLVHTVAFGANQRAIFGGVLDGTVTFGPDTIASGGEQRGYWARTNPAGVATDASVVSIEGPNAVRDLKVYSDERILLGLGGNEGGLVLVGLDGSEDWAKELHASVLAVTFDTDAIYAAGSFQGALSIDGIEADSFEDSTDAFVARFDPVDGTLEWFTPIGGAGPDIASGVVVGCDGRLVAVLGAENDLFAGDIFLPAGGGVDVVAVRLDREGGTIASATRHGGPGDQVPFTLDVRNGAPLVTGVFAGAMDIGGETLESAGGLDVFVVQAPLAPAGPGRR